MHEENIREGKNFCQFKKLCCIRTYQRIFLYQLLTRNAKSNKRNYANQNRAWLSDIYSSRFLNV